MTDGRQALVPAKTAAVRGAGGGGSKKQRSPIEAPDSLQSIARARILDLIGEGEIEGFASDVPGVVAENALTAIFLDETPVANADGSLNFKDVQVDTRLGTQHQEHIAGFPSVENEIGVGQELTPDAPYVRAINNRDLSAVRLRISTPALSSADSETGDISGISVQYAIDLAVDGGPYRQVLRSALTGKTTSGYERSHRIDLPEATAGWIIRIRRITPMAGSATVADATFVESFTEIVDGKFRYPNSALVGITVDAAQFGSIPTRAYRVLGRRMAVPSNYDPVTRTYSGSWDGTFKTAWTNNPAWVWYDLVVHDRFGLGDRIDARQVNKWHLYRIAQYCDQLVPDGRGGMEPRFTCHLYLQTRNDALRVLQDLASVFRTMAYWSGGEVMAVADMPADPVYVYNNANVVDGRFTYSGSPGSTRYTVALVSWSDPDDFGRQKIEPVQDEQGIARYGIRQTEVIAIGCQSRGQAQRMGRWILLTSRLETDTVNFNVALDGTIAMPGQIVEVADSLRAQARIGGRVRSATRTVVTVDAAGPIAPGDTLTCVMPDAVSQSRVVESVAGNEITVASAFTAAPVPDSVWAVSSPTLSTQRVRVLSVRKGEGLEVTITALRHVADKFAAVDHGTTVELPPIVPQLPGKVQLPPTDLQVTHREVATDNAAYLVVSLEWKAPPGAVSYDVEWRQSHGSWTTAGRVYSTTLEVRNVLPGPFEFRVVAVNAAGLQSVPAYGGYYEVPPNSAQPGYVEDLENDLDQARNEFLAEVLRVQDLVDAVAAQAAADAAALSVRADDLRADIDATIAEVSTLADLTDGLGTEITRVETESVARDTATVETISLLGAKNGAGTAFILDGNTLRVSPTETLAQWRTGIQGEFASQSSRIDNEVQARQDGDEALATTLATVQATANNAATKAELTAAQNALAAADQAEANARNALAVQLRGGYTGTNPAALTQGLIYNERQARLTAEGAIASTVSAMQLDLNGKAAASDLAATQLTVSQHGNTLTAHGTQLSGLSASVGGNTASINELREVSVAAAAGSGLANGDFESGTSHWNFTNAVISETFPRSGRYHFRYNGGPSAGTAESLVPFKVDPSTPVRLSFWARETPAPPNGNVRLAIRWLDSSGSQISYVTTNASLSPGTATSYRKVTGTAQPPAGAVYARIVVQALNTSGGWCVDDVVATVPSPTQADILARYSLAVTAGGDVAGMQLLAGGGTSAIRFLANMFSVVDPSGTSGYTHSAGVSIWRIGGAMIALGPGFGAGNEFIFWAGPNQSNLNNCTRANAGMYFTRTNDAYFGGSLSAGVFKNAATSSQTNNRATVETGRFGTNGKPKSVVSSMTYSNNGVVPTANVPPSGAISATIVVERRRNGTGSWTNIGTYTASGNIIVYPPIDGESSVDISMGGSFTTTDSSTGLQDFEYRARITDSTGAWPWSNQLGSPGTQSLTIMSVEEP